MRTGIGSWTVSGAIVMLATLLSCSSPLGPSATSPLLGKNTAGTAQTLSDSTTTLGAPWPTWKMGGATGEFRWHPDPPQGPAPLEVTFNMCHSTDPSAGFNLHYHVDWGDGSDDRGNCRFDHLYETGGQFSGVACVWDEIPAHFPGACVTTLFTVTGTHTPTQSSFKPPTVGVTHTTGVVSGNPWIVCRADSSTAWITSDVSGTYNGIAACQSIGYTSITGNGGTCGTVCGYCGSPTETYDGSNGCVFPQMCNTVAWRCAR